MIRSAFTDLGVGVALVVFGDDVICRTEFGLAYNRGKSRAKRGQHPQRSQLALRAMKTKACFVTGMPVAADHFKDAFFHRLAVTEDYLPAAFGWRARRCSLRHHTLPSFRPRLALILGDSSCRGCSRGGCIVGMMTVFAKRSS